MIKKLITPLAFVLLLCAACKKESDVNVSSSAQPQEESAINSRLLTTPAAFTQKLLIEMFGTVHCGTCPDMEQKCRTQMANHAGRVFGYAAHSSDAMDIGLFNYYDSIYNVSTYASGMLNRVPINGVVVVPKSNFNTTNVNNRLAKIANCGVQITSSLSGTTATITVDAGFNATLSGSYNLTTVLCQDSVVGFGYNYDQSNYYNTIVGSLWYGLGNPMIGYKHDFVSRKVLSTKSIGDAISSTYIKAGGFFSKTYTVNIGTWNPRQLYVIAFINKVGLTSTTHEVMNVQSTKLGTNKNFD